MSKKRTRTDSGVRIQVSHALPVIAELESNNTTTTITSKSVTIRPGKRGRYTQRVSHGEMEEAADNGTQDISEDYGEYDSGMGLLDADFAASSLEDTPNPESVREEVEADTENVKKTVHIQYTSCYRG